MLITNLYFVQLSRYGFAKRVNYNRVKCFGHALRNRNGPENVCEVNYHLLKDMRVSFRKLDRNDNV